MEIYRGNSPGLTLGEFIRTVFVGRSKFKFGIFTVSEVCKTTISTSYAAPNIVLSFKNLVMSNVW